MPPPEKPGVPRPGTPKDRSGETVRLRLLPHPEGASLLRARFVSFSYCPHSHDLFSIGQTLEGLQDFRCGGRPHRGHPGTVITINPGEVHDGHGGLPSGFSYQMLYLPEAYVTPLAKELWPHLPRTPFFPTALHAAPTSAALLGTLFRRLSDPASSLLEVQSLLVHALAILLLRHGGLPPPSKPLPGRVQNVQDARDYIRENASEHLSLEELAARFDHTPHLFLRRFRQVVGLPPHRYQIQCRVERAKRLLARGTPLPEVALASGFCDQSHLNRRFREICGVTPGGYQAALGAGEPDPPASGENTEVETWSSTRGWRWWFGRT